MTYHTADRDVTETLIALAPDFWQEIGIWERARPYFEAYLSRRAFMEACQR